MCRPTTTVLHLKYTRMIARLTTQIWSNMFEKIWKYWTLVAVKRILLPILSRLALGIPDWNGVKSRLKLTNEDFPNARLHRPTFL
jgi:hypothetical protein